MKTVKMADEIKRVSNDEAERLVSSGWAYAKKEVWKKQVRDKGKTKPIPPKTEEKVVKSAKPPRKKAYDN